MASDNKKESRLKNLARAMMAAGSEAADAVVKTGKEFVEDTEALVKGEKLPHAGKDRKSKIPKVVPRRTEAAIEKAIN